MLVDHAQGLVERVIPPRRARRPQAISAAIAEMHRWGLTGVHDAGAVAAMIELYEELGEGEGARPAPLRDDLRQRRRRSTH